MHKNYPDVEFEYTVNSTFNFYAHEKFENIIKEIIDNGIEHNNSNKKRIKIESINQGKTKQIIIMDNGNGIPEHELKPIFNAKKHS